MARKNIQNNRAADASPFVPDSQSLATLKKHARDCQGCELYKVGTQTVFGRGAAHAKLMLVGEQPGDQEDLAGLPFVGPSGALLAKALSRGDIPEDALYITNAVKHFRWHQAGKRRIGDKPTVTHIRACRPWLEAEIESVQPKVVVALGTTAGQSLFQRPVSIQKDGYRFVTSEEWEAFLLLLPHPSSLLRLRSREERDQAVSLWAEWLKRAWDQTEVSFSAHAPKSWDAGTESAPLS